MKKLNSNGLKSGSQEWYGLDASQIVYPDVLSCVTVTCVVERGLAGLHLASNEYPAATNADITTYSGIAKGATAMYVVGMLSGRWTPPNFKNRTGLTYGSGSGGTLIARLRAAAGFNGVVCVRDTSELGEQLDITASLSSGVVTFTYAADGGAQALTGWFEHVGGDVMHGPQQESGGCAIL